MLIDKCDFVDAAQLLYLDFYSYLGIVSVIISRFNADNGPVLLDKYSFVDASQLLSPRPLLPSRKNQTEIKVHVYCQYYHLILRFRDINRRNSSYLHSIRVPLLHCLHFCFW